MCCFYLILPHVSCLKNWDSVPDYMVFRAGFPNDLARSHNINVLLRFTLHASPSNEKTPKTGREHVLRDLPNAKSCELEHCMSWCFPKLSPEGSPSLD